MTETSIFIVDLKIVGSETLLVFAGVFLPMILNFYVSCALKCTAPSFSLSSSSRS